MNVVLRMNCNDSLSIFHLAPSSGHLSMEPQPQPPLCKLAILCSVLACGRAKDRKHCTSLTSAFKNCHRHMTAFLHWHLAPVVPVPHDTASQSYQHLLQLLIEIILCIFFFTAVCNKKKKLSSSFGKKQKHLLK